MANKEAFATENTQPISGMNYKLADQHFSKRTLYAYHEAINLADSLVITVKEQPVAYSNHSASKYRLNIESFVTSIEVSDTITVTEQYDGALFPLVIEVSA